MVADRFKHGVGTRCLAMPSAETRCRSEAGKGRLRLPVTRLLMTLALTLVARSFARPQVTRSSTVDTPLSSSSPVSPRATTNLRPSRSSIAT